MSENLSPEVLCINCEYPIFADQYQCAVAAGPNEGSPRHEHTTACYVAGRRVNESQARRIAELEGQAAIDRDFITQYQRQLAVVPPSDVPKECFDADALLAQLPPWHRARTSKENICDAMDALTKLIRKRQPVEPEPYCTCPSDYPMQCGHHPDCVSQRVEDEPVAANRMRIAYDAQYRTIWHEDCAVSAPGIMREADRKEGHTVMECLACKQRGRYPVGGNGSLCVDIVGQSPHETGDSK